MKGNNIQGGCAYRLYARRRKVSKLGNKLNCVFHEHLKMYVIGSAIHSILFYFIFFIFFFRIFFLFFF